MTPAYDEARKRLEKLADGSGWETYGTSEPPSLAADLRALLSSPPEPSEEEVAAIQVAKQRLKIWDGYGGFNTPESVIDQANGVADALRAVLALFRSRING